MQHHTNFNYTFNPRHLRSKPKKTIKIFVSAGSFSEPYYTFANKRGKTLKSLELDPTQKYRFTRTDKALTHPFYISDQGWNQPATTKIKIRGDGNFNSGIFGAETFTISIKKRQQKQFAASGRLFFYCTSHESMTGEFIINPGRKNLRQPASDQPFIQPIPADNKGDYYTSSDTHFSPLNTVVPWPVEEVILD